MKNDVEFSASFVIDLMILVALKVPGQAGCCLRMALAELCRRDLGRRNVMRKNAALTRCFGSAQEKRRGMHQSTAIANIAHVVFSETEWLCFSHYPAIS